MRNLVLPILLLIAACHRDRSPEAPTARQSDQLNEAEDMLNGIAGNKARNEEGAAPTGTAPSSNQD